MTRIISKDIACKQLAASIFALALLYRGRLAHGNSRTAHQYRDGDTLLEGFFCHDESRSGPLPIVMISHAQCGRDEFVERKVRRLAWHGFATFALDMYGKGKRGLRAEENRALMGQFMQDRALLSRRINAALAAVKSLQSSGFSRTLCCDAGDNDALVNFETTDPWAQQ